MMFEEFFEIAMGRNGIRPYGYQMELATCTELPQVINFPTGSGKTASIVLAWLWRRRYAPFEVRRRTPRRLVYCLPMRVLVEQTENNVRFWLNNLGLLDRESGVTQQDEVGSPDSGTDENRVAVTVLMGGEEPTDWDLYPEKETVIIGTQDMLLSRALNRGYAMSRYRWPLHFGLLNNDCLWVLDEVQLMGSGLPTTAQIQGLRENLGTLIPCQTVWMSATLRADWLKTPDFDPTRKDLRTITIGSSDLQSEDLRRRYEARKTLVKAQHAATNPDGLSREVLTAHKPHSRTLVIVNTVRRAVELYERLEEEGTRAKLVLVHSRFRPPDKRRTLNKMLEEPGPHGSIVVSTQVVEAGVDISAKTLFTELAPWPSLVQRFGRCNRLGTDRDSTVYWIDLPIEEEEILAAPYSREDLSVARTQLTALESQDVGPQSLPAVESPRTETTVLRRKDLIELFDTTPDLTGHDLDISRFVRETSDTDVAVFWRDFPGVNPENEPRPSRDELCPVPISDIRDIVRHGENAWTWDPIERQWKKVSRDAPVAAGAVIMLDAKEGRYDESVGWNLKVKKPVPVSPVQEREVPEGDSSDELSEGDWKTIPEHSDEVVERMRSIFERLELKDPWFAWGVEAARWHDSGKAHPFFQSRLDVEQTKETPVRFYAKAPKDAWKARGPASSKHDNETVRRHFRHELVSALLAIEHGLDDAACYLIASHHGKVRVSIRSIPDEDKPPAVGKRYARGVWEGDVIPEVDLGGGVLTSRTTIDLSLMELGQGDRGPSWLGRTVALRNCPDIGPFRLAFMEALLKAADERASRMAI